MYTMQSNLVLSTLPTTTILRRLPPLSAAASPPATRYKTLRTRSLPPNKLDILKSVEPWVAESVLPLLRPVDQSWQPSDFLPVSSQPYDQFSAEVKALRDRTTDLPDDLLVALVGNMISEEALPTYQKLLNTLDGVRDETCSSPNPWAIWTRAWTAEENRHGDLLSAYLYLSGRVDMNMIEKTIHYLIGSGMNIGTECNPYLGFVYTSFQERVAFTQHGNTARLAKESGDPILARICGTIASDEKRHENAYVKIVEKLLEVDPTGVMLGVATMMKKNITMPAHLMFDGHDPSLFFHFSIVTQRLGLYTAGDYADILEYLVKRWRLEKIEDLTDEGRYAQEFVCGLASRIRKFQERADERAKKMEPYGIKFSWIFNREVLVG